RRDRSCPRSQAKAVSICGNTPEISDTASRSTRNPETNRAESLYSPDVRGGPYLICTTRAEHFLDALRRGCTASAFLQLSRYFDGVFPDSVPWVQPNTFGLGPKRRRGLLRMRCRSAKRWL